MKDRTFSILPQTRLQLFCQIAFLLGFASVAASISSMLFGPHVINSLNSTLENGKSEASTYTIDTSCLTPQASTQEIEVVLACEGALVRRMIISSPHGGVVTIYAEETYIVVGPIPANTWLHLQTSDQPDLQVSELRDRSIIELQSQPQIGSVVTISVEPSHAPEFSR